MPRNYGKWAYTYEHELNITKEKLKEQGFQKYQRYKYFCVFSKYDKDGNFLYHESFSWFDLGKIIKPDYNLTYQKPSKRKKSKPYSSKMHKGGI